MKIDTFERRPAGCKNITVSSSTARVKVCDDHGDVDVEITNDGTATVWIEFGDEAVEAAAATGNPVGAGVCKVLRAPEQNSPLYIAAIAAGATGIIYFDPGSGA